MVIVFHLVKQSAKPRGFLFSSYDVPEINKSNTTSTTSNQCLHSTPYDDSRLLSGHSLCTGCLLYSTPTPISLCFSVSGGTTRARAKTSETSGIPMSQWTIWGGGWPDIPLTFMLISKFIFSLCCKNNNFMLFIHNCYQKWEYMCTYCIYQRCIINDYS